MRNNGRFVIAGGSEQLDYVITVLQENKKKLIIINDDEKISNRISEKHNIPVYVGSPISTIALTEAGVKDAEVFIALDKRDTHNLVSCLLAKKLFNAKKCICTVTDPKNVEIFQDLGIDSVMCSTHFLAESIKTESNIEDVVKTLSLEKGKINIIEIKIGSDDYAAFKRIMDLGLPTNANIACVYRNPNVIIPNGQTTIRPHDKLTVVTEPKDSEMITNFLKLGK